jgi:single-stranded DNA-binding protein
MPPTDAVPSVNSVCLVTPERRHTMDNGNVADTEIIESERVIDQQRSRR